MSENIQQIPPTQGAGSSQVFPFPAPPQFSHVAHQSLNQPGGGGTSGSMDAWQQSVETRLGHLFQAFAAGFVVLLVGGVAAYLMLAAPLHEVKTDVAVNTEQLKHLNEKTDKIDEKLDAVLDRLPKSTSPAGG